MKLLSLTYRIIPEKEGGYSVKCLDWSPVITQGDNIIECKKNAIEATEAMPEILKEGKLAKAVYPKVKTHAANPYHFQLSFDVESARFIQPSSIFRKVKSHSLRSLTAIF
jgi:predicted RNase H-like HicB family nuclease